MGTAKGKFSKTFFPIALLLFTAISIAPSQATLIGSGACQSDVGSTASVSVATSGSYCYIAFAATGTNSWKAPAGVNSFDAVIVGGGGSGGAGAWGGGGGAGGVVVYNGYAVSPGTVINLSVGAGGTPGGDSLAPASNRSNNGSDSWIVSASSVVATGGGAGASYAYNTAGYTAGSNGGSGGGGTEDMDNSRNFGGSSTQTLPSGAAAKYGFGGGAGGTTTTRSGGGGGGAGGVGSGASNSIGGNGGAGTNAVSTYLNVFATPFGVSGYIAGGGGGGSDSTSPQATGGSGGGGNGGYNSSTPGVSGLANTGSGGGGSTYNGNTAAGSGGSGLIILRFIADVVPPSFTSGTSFSLPENTPTNVTAAIITVSESATITISSGVDSATFSINQSDSRTALITFKVSPNYEAPTDVGANNVYDVTLSATDPSGNTSTQAITITVTDVLDTTNFGTFALTGNATTAYFRTLINITVVVTAPSKVTFRVNGVIIPGCKNKPTTGATPNATVICPWKPSVRNSATLSAIATPTGNGITGASASFKVYVYPRVGNR